MLRRVLIYFKGAEDVDHLLSFGKLLKGTYGMELAGIHLKPAIIPTIIDGELAIGTEVSEIIEEERLESEALSKKIKEKFVEKFGEVEFYSEEGGVDKLLEKLKYFDLLILDKKDMIDSEFKEILKKHNKPILLIPKLEEYRFEGVLFANDMDLKSNKSFFRFMNIFEKFEEYEILTVNIDPDLELKKYTDKVVGSFTYTSSRGQIPDEILKALKSRDLLVMGNLKHSLIYEKITKKTGITLIEKAEKPIFIA